MVESQVPAFRDAYHFYYPQAVWLQHCAQQGSYFPSWNPSEGLGVSVAGQPSAALYYPLRWLWWMPWLSVAQKFSLVIVVHLLIAAAGLKIAAHKLGCTDSAGWLAAISFSLSCPVFFQHTNLIYLCSAAWIGFALAAVFDVLQATSRRHYVKSCAIFGCAASLMLLAGDPQSAANTFIVASVIFAAEFAQRRWRPFSVVRAVQREGGAACFRSRSRQTLDKPSDVQSLATSATHIRSSSWEPKAECKVLGRQVLWLLGALCLVVMLGSVQWLPAWRWASHSGRVTTAFEYDAATAHTSIVRAPADSLVDLPVGRSADAAETKQTTVVSTTPAVDAVLRASGPVVSHRYDFSLSPWNALTCLWPTLGGHYLPSNSRLFAILPAEGRMWIPSLYFGCWPCLLMLLAVFRNRCRLARTLKIVGLVALLAALGNYSIVWLVRELLSGVGLAALAAHLPKDHVGSLMWMINALVPGYSMFRYPAKWTVWIVAAASLLAAQQLSSSASRECILPNRLRLTLLVLSLTGLTLSGCLATARGLGYSFDAWLAAIAADQWLGPPNTRAIANSLVIAFGVPSVVLGLSTLKCSMVVKKWGLQAGSLRHSETQAGSLRHVVPSLTLITLAEMTLCASCWIHFLPAPNLVRELHFTTLPDQHLDQLGAAFVWSNRGQADLLRDHFVQSPQTYAQDQASYQCEWLLGKLGVLADVRCLHAAQSIDPREVVQLRAWLSRHDRLQTQQPEVDRVLRELGVTHRLVRSQPVIELLTPEQLTPEQADSPAQFTWQAIADPSPLCQVVVGQDGPASIDSKLGWRWISPGKLVIQASDVHTEPASDSVLVVRQTNDGGWLARDASGRSLAIRRQPLFVELELPDAVGEITLSRKWFW